MSSAGRARVIIEKRAGVRLFRSARVPRGVDVYLDMANGLPSYRPEVMFDVGANVGLASAEFLAAFPAATVFGFEPVGRTFARLQERFRGDSRVTPIHVALGAGKGTGTMREGGASTQAVLTAGVELESDENVEIDTVDGVSEQRGISRIGYLKVDTEGHDLEVLNGATRMLSEGQVDLVQVEAGMNPGNDLHVPFGVLQQHLEGHGYRLFGVYEQKEEWILREPYLRRSNAVYISERIVHEFKQ